VDASTPISVHLCDYPESNESLIDRELLSAMEAAQRVVALGRAARDKSGIRVRQPLARLYVKVPTKETEADVAKLRDIILDELNVKALEFAGTAEEYLQYSVKPNLPVLGPKYGKRLGAIRSTLESLDAASVAQAVERGESVQVEVAGESIELLPQEVLPSAREREGYAAMASDGFLVALDTELTPQLVHEGWAREVVRRINDWRKSAGFDVEDRIAVHYRATDELAAAIREHRDYVCQETLAVALEETGADAGGYHAQATFGGQDFDVSLHRRAGSFAAS
jgi:isoleucyl-tRNA synthetase